MMKQILIITFLILAGAGASFAQTVEQQVGRIRTIYAETNRRIQAGAKDKTLGFHYAEWTVGGERDGQQWAAVGNMKTQAECWFDGAPDEGEEAVDGRKLVRKIVSTYAGAADLRSRAEYIFDENSGELIFAFTTELDPEGKQFERRFYYQKGKLIRLVRDGKNIDRSVGEEDKQLAANAQSDAKDLQTTFVLIFS